MDFDLTDEQRLLQDSAGRLLDDRYADFARRAEATRAEYGYDEAIWRQLAELGLLGLPFAEADGGSGGGPVETMLVMEAFGRTLAPEPWLPFILLGGGVLRRVGHSLIPRVIDGSARVALAHGERQARYDRHDIATVARPADGGWTLSGEKCVVLAGDSATHLVVSARTAGGRRDADGIALFLVAASTPGVTRRAYPTQDGLRAADIVFEAAPAECLIEAGAPLLDAVLDAALAALCAEAVGAMAALQALTVDYLKQRKQFGVTIGSFQALQHRAVDMLIAVEQARSMAMDAAMMADEPNPAARRAAIAGAKVQVNRSSRLVGQEAIQLHGGIAMTMEYKAGHYFKRLAVIETLFGDTDHHLRVAAAAL